MTQEILTSLSYKCPEDLVNAQCLMHTPELKVFLDTTPVQPIIEYTCSSLEALYAFLANSDVKGALHFVPEQAVQSLEKLGFTILGEYTDYFTTAPAIGVYPPPVFATREDAAALARITQSLVGTSRGFFGETEAWFQDWLRENQVIIDRVGQEIVGLCCYSIYNDGCSLWIRELAVAQAHQGKGIGKKLLCQALDVGFTKGTQKAFLSVDAANVNAIQIYEACGFWRSAEPPEIQMLR